MQTSSLAGDVKTTTYMRLQRWRRRQQLLWPGLFSDFQTTDDVSNEPKASHSITLQSFRNVEYQLLIDNIPIIVCDGCGALQQLCQSHASSDSTLSPSKERAMNPYIVCSSCRFPTPLGHFRTLLSLPHCGPHLSPSLALALLVEAAGSQFSVADTHSNLHDWIRDQKCRMHGLHLLLGAIGCREEQLCPPQPSAYDCSAQSSSSQEQQTKFYDARRAERYLESKFSSKELPQLPFSVANLHPDNSKNKQSGTAAERAKQILKDVSGILKECRANVHDKHLIFKLNNLAREFRAAQIEARICNHSCIFPLHSES